MQQRKGIELLTGLPAGERQGAGIFPEGFNPWQGRASVGEHGDSPRGVRAAQLAAPIQERSVAEPANEPQMDPEIVNR